MNKIEEVKQEVRHREWAEQVRECQSSGLAIKEWCRQNGINVYTYYRRLRKLRKELLESKGTNKPQIVPISISSEISGTALINQTPELMPVPMPDSKVTEKGADASAAVMTIIETAKRNDLDVYGYLLYLLTALPEWGPEPTDEQIDSVMPWNSSLPDYCRQTYSEIQLPTAGDTNIE